VARTTGSALRVAILGLGEAGGRLARDLVELGVVVSGWDPAIGPPTGVRSTVGPLEAVEGSQVVLSVNSAHAAAEAARECAAGLAGVELFADLNTAAPSVKVAVANVVAAQGVAFADVALMAPVPNAGLRTPALVSGSGAGRFAETFGPLGMPVEIVGAEPGAAARRKLLRSIFMKGLAAAVVESIEAADAAGCGQWLREEIRGVLEAADGSLLDRLVEGSSRHARRRVDEMEAATALLRELGVEPRVAAASAAQLTGLARLGNVVPAR
jgi:3-hydroxyisobutyrate dehydrogenase-like beta-hydroxyacid dehydrogenase